MQQSIQDSAPPPSARHAIVQLHFQLGNRTFTSLFRSYRMQAQPSREVVEGTRNTTKLCISQPGDPEELEASRVAELVIGEDVLLINFFRKWGRSEAIASF